MGAADVPRGRAQALSRMQAKKGRHDERQFAQQAPAERVRGGLAKVVTGVINFRPAASASTAGGIIRSSNDKRPIPENRPF